MAPFQEALGIHVTGLGHAEIDSNAAYPPENHPTGRAFSWEKGRIIHALQIVAIREGGGVVQWMGEEHAVYKGTAFILKPGEWHRYRPVLRSGWVEDWLEIRGHFVDHWLDSGLLQGRFVKLANPNRFFGEIDSIHDAVTRAGFLPQGVLESRALGLVAEIELSQTNAATGAVRADEREMISRARRMLTEGENIDLIAKQLGVSYQRLYRSFKRLTGLSPKQFAERARLANAEGLLAGDQLSVKEIASELGYYTASHFSLAFKRFYGVSPSAWRTKLDRGDRLSV